MSSDRPFSVSGPSSLSGQVVQSEFQPGVSYRLERRIGEGGMGQAFLALQQAPDSISPVAEIKLDAPERRVGRAELGRHSGAKRKPVALGQLQRAHPRPAHSWCAWSTRAPRT